MFLFVNGVICMDITKYPQFQLFLLTLHLLNLKNQLIPENCDEWCVNATIINRAYYSAYMFCELWLEDIKGFKVIEPWEFQEGEKVISEHKQVRMALSENYNQEDLGYILGKLASLRKKADYEPFVDITNKEVSDAIGHMEKIITTLKFQ